MTLIETHGLKKEYLMGSVVVNALRGVDVKISKGEFVALVGPSGSGKSTLMHLIGGLDFPTEGTVTVDGEDLYEMTESELAHFRGIRVGFVFQSFNLFNLLSARENVYFPMQFSDIPFSEWGERAEKLLELVKLREWADHKPTEMSGGQQQRVAIARALANDPSILLADEATGELDTKTSIEIMELFDRIRQERGTTIVLVTHDSDMAAMSDRLIHIVDGHVVSDTPNPSGLKGRRQADRTGEADEEEGIDDLKAEEDAATTGDDVEGPSTEAVEGTTKKVKKGKRSKTKKKSTKKAKRPSKKKVISDEVTI